MPKKRATTKERINKIYQSKDYFSDCTKPGMLYAAIVRSPIENGKITNIYNIDLPEGYRLFTERDIPGKNKIQTLDSVTRVFCKEHVHYKGEPVGLIVGEDLETVRKLASEIQITFDITSIESALKSVAEEYSHPTIKLPEHTPIAKDSAIADFVDMMNVMPALDELPKPAKTISYTQPGQIPSIVENIKNIKTKKTQNVVAERIIRTGLFEKNTRNSYIEKIFSSADHDIQGTWEQTEKIPNWNEPNGAFSYMDGNTLTVLTTTQWPAHLQQALQDVLNIDAEHIVIKKTLTQKTNRNGTWRTSTLAVQAALATLQTGKPVKLLLTKEEQEEYFNKDIKVYISHRSAVKSDGTIDSMMISIQADVGADNPFAKEIIDRLTISACGLYNPENLYIHAQAISSKTPPTSISPEKTDCHSFFAIENHIQQIANALEMLPQDVRVKNICLETNKQKSPFKFKFAKPLDALESIIKQSDFNRKYTSFKLESLRNKNELKKDFFALPKRGIGLACAFDGSGYFGSTIFSCDQKVEVTLNLDGNLTIHAPQPSTTIAEIWKKTAAEILQIKTDAIHIVSEYPEGEIPDLPENIYNNISVMTYLIKKSCLEIQKKRFHSPLPITSKKTITPAMKKNWNKELFSGIPFHTTSFAGIIVEIELNPDTYKTKIKGIWLVIDCGEILSIKAAENTIRLAIQKELLTLMKDESLSLPYQCLRVCFVESKNNSGQIGDLVHKILPAAFTNALSQAISDAIYKIPVSEETLYKITINNEEQIIEKMNNKSEKPEVLDSTQEENAKTVKND